MAGPRLLSFFLFPLHGIQILYDRSSFLLQLTWTRNRRAISYFYRVFFRHDYLLYLPVLYPGDRKAPTLLYYARFSEQHSRICRACARAP